MTLELNPVQPPRLAVWLLNLFVLAEEAEPIQGDLLEEFSLLASKSGVPFARRWYWRQTIKTVPKLAGVGFRSAPWLTSAAIVGGFLLRKLLGPLVGPAIFAMLERFQVFEHHFDLYMFLASTGMDIAHLIVFLFVGFVVALAARGREMLPTMTLSFVYAMMALVASVYVVAKTGEYAYLWRLTWYFADAFAIVFAGAMVRSHRFPATSQPSNA